LFKIFHGDVRIMGFQIGIKIKQWSFGEGCIGEPELIKFELVGFVGYFLDGFLVDMLILFGCIEFRYKFGFGEGINIDRFMAGRAFNFGDFFVGAIAVVI